MRTLTIILLAATSLAACHGPTCTKRGCESSITLLFTGPDDEPVSDVRGTLTVDGTEIEFDCVSEDYDDTIHCFEGGISVTVESGEAAQFIVTTSDDLLEMSGDLTLDFEDVYPNGEECGVGCQTSEHEVMLDDSPMGG